MEAGAGPAGAAEPVLSDGICEQGCHRAWKTPGNPLRPARCANRALILVLALSSCS